ncbi:MAG: galactokinase [Leeuwenhoekiella sp.]
MDQIYTLAHSPEQLAQIGRFNASVIVNSPGRVNLIGEHTDYNNGYVMPTAIDKTIKFYLKKNGSDNQCSIKSLNYGATLDLDLQNPDLNGDEWTLYIIGVIEEMKKLGVNLTGFDCLMYSDLPMGAGISSSAALECGLAYGLNTLFDLGLTKIDLVKLSQKAEHNYVGTQCGIMDQFASVMSENGHVIKLDCKTLDYELLPFDIEPYKLLLLNTNVSHSLSSSEYNTRRKECEEGVKTLQLKYPHINSLRDASFAELESCKNDISEIVFKRCQYILEENDRVLKAAEALKNNDLETFGKLMYASHEGLQHKYEVSCEELDFLTDFSRDNAEILGCRMMGGGFGGCTINLIHEDAVAGYIEKASKAYTEAFDIKLTAFTTLPANGSSLIEL